MRASSTPRTSGAEQKRTMNASTAYVLFVRPAVAMMVRSAFSQNSIARARYAPHHQLAASGLRARAWQAHHSFRRAARGHGYRPGHHARGQEARRGPARGRLVPAPAEVCRLATSNVNPLTQEA